MASWVEVDELQPLLDAVGPEGVHVLMHFETEHDIDARPGDCRGSTVETRQPMMLALTYAMPSPTACYIQTPDSAGCCSRRTRRRPSASATRAKPEFSTRQSLMVVAQPDAGCRLSPCTETADSLLFATSAVTIAIDKRTAAFTYLDSQGKLLTKEPARGGKTLMPVDVVVSVFDEATSPMETGVTADGVRVRARNVRQVVDRQAYHTKLEFEWADGEALYGLGSHEEGMLNLRGQHQYLYQQNMKAVVPVLVSTRGYGILLDSYSLMTFHDDAFGSYLWTE